MSIRVVPASREVAKQALASPKKLVRVYSFFPCDRAYCDCAKLIADWKRRISEAKPEERQKLVADTPFIECPRDKTGLTRFAIHCARCKQLQGYCWASTPDLFDWCDFHYVSWSKGDKWNGNFGTHISPITEQLCLECVCGYDTRDFRANTQLHPSIVEDLEKEASKGRLFNQKDSKFIVRQASKKVLT